MTTMQRMSHPVRRLSPPPDVALKRICQTTLGLPAPRPVEASGSNQHRSVPLKPRRSCKNQFTVRKFASDDNIKVCQMHKRIVVCIMSAKCLHNICKSVHKVCMIHLVHTWHMIEKSARDADFYAYLHHFCFKSARVCIKCASSLHFSELRVVPRSPGRW